MSENNMEYLTLCSSCKNAGDCIFQKDRLKPALYCEEFEIDMYPSTKIAGKDQPLATAAANDKVSTKFIGLCSDCESRQTCVFPKPEGGIWHCQEYR